MIDNPELQLTEELNIIEQFRGGEIFTEPLRNFANQK